MTDQAQKYVFVAALAALGSTSKANYVLTNPPFNESEWRGELLRCDPRWVYCVLRAGNSFSNLISIHRRQVA